MTNHTTGYSLPDGFTVAALGEADSDWNGFPVPVLDTDEYLRLGAHLDAITEENGEEQYTAEYVADGKVTPGFYCDGLQWSMCRECSFGIGPHESHS